MMNFKTTTASFAAAALLALGSAASASTVTVTSNGSDSAVIGTIDDITDLDFSVGNVSGTATITIVDFSVASQNGTSPFSATFEFFSGTNSIGGVTLGSNTQGQSVGSFPFGGEELSGTVTAQNGSADFEVAVNVTSVPVPAAGFLLTGAIGGFAMLRRRKS